MGTHALALCLGPRSACVSQRSELAVGLIVTTATVAVLSLVPLHPPHLVPTHTTLAVHQTTSEHVCSPNVQLSAGRDGVLFQGTLRIATALLKLGVVLLVGGEGGCEWAGGLWLGTRRTVIVTVGVHATMTGPGVNATVSLLMRVRKTGECSMIPGRPAPQTRCDTVRQVRTVTTVRGAQREGAGLTMQRIAMQAQMMLLQC